MSASIHLKPGRENSLRQRHPWIFSGAVERVEGSPQAGETVEVCAASGERLGWAAFSPHSKIRARLWSFDPADKIDQAFFRRLLQQALGLRQAIIPQGETDALRLVFAESDGLPGWVVDRYADWLVVQFLSCGAEYWRETLVDLLAELTNIHQIYERSDVEVRRLEGLPERTGVYKGIPPPERVLVHENGLRFWVDIQRGQKTGFYLDQRANRQRVRELAGGRKVLNCFCYTGAFTVYALAGGATEVLSVDAAGEALNWGSEHILLNGLPVDKALWLKGDVFQVLRQLRDRGETFDMVILDPPKFAPTAAQAERAARGYKDINLLGFKLLRPGGLLVTFSCSGGISADLFQKIVAGAAEDAGVDALILERLTQGIDHPVGLSFPEGAYLKGLICRIRG